MRTRSPTDRLPAIAPFTANMSASASPPFTRTSCPKLSTLKLIRYQIYLSRKVFSSFVKAEISSSSFPKVFTVSKLIKVSTACVNVCTLDAKIQRNHDRMCVSSSVILPRQSFETSAPTSQVQRAYPICMIQSIFFWNMTSQHMRSETWIKLCKLRRQNKSMQAPITRKRAPQVESNRVTYPLQRPRSYSSLSESCF